MTTTINNEHKKLNFSSEREQSQACLNSAEHEKNQGRKVLNVPNKREQNQTCLDSAEREGLRPNGNVPNLRFPEFQGEWEKCTLGNNVKIQGGYAFKSELFLRKGIPIIRISNLPQNASFVDLDDCTYYKEGNYNSFEVHNGDLLIAMSGATTGKTAIYNKKTLAYLNQRVGLFKSTNSDSLYYPFLYAFVSTPVFKRQLSTRLIAGAQPNISSSDIESIRISIPSKGEQKKIATLLRLIDERIATQNKIIDKLQSLIKGLRVRLVQIEKGNIVHLNEIASIYQPQTISSTELTEDGFCVYGANGIIGKYKEYNHKTEQICITCRGNTCGMVNYTKPMSWITGNAMVINTDEHQDDVCKRYLFHYLSAYNFNRIISGSGQPQIVRTPLEKLKITLPSILEQEQKAMLLDKIQAKIEISNSVLSLYQEQKQYLLRQMFI